MKAYETPRQKQLRRRNVIKEYIGWGIIAIFPYLLLIDWLIIGY